MYGQKYGRKFVKPLRIEKNMNGQKKRAKLDNARRLRGIYFIDPDDEEYREILKKREEKNWKDPFMAPAMPCERSPNGITKVTAKPEIANKHRESEREPENWKWKTNSKTVYVWKVESRESTWQRVESSQPKNHEDHIASKGFTSMTHHNLVHKFIPMPQVMKIPDAKAAVGKEWKKLETIPAWSLEKVKSKKEIILEAQRDKRKVHFATLMDLCHLKNADLEPKLQKYKGRVVLPGYIVKDDSGAHAVFTEQGSSASQMTAAKVLDVTAILPDCNGQAADAVSAYTQVK